MVDVPADNAETTPLEDPTVATVVLELLHEPPSEALLSVDVAPSHMLVFPVIAGNAPTVNTLVAKQPSGIR
jgi:hypothetical protein